MSSAEILSTGTQLLAWINPNPAQDYVLSWLSKEIVYQFAKLQCMRQFNNGAQSAAKILNLTANEPMPFKRKRKLLEQGSYQGFYKM